MSVLEKILDVLPLNEERRRYQRVRVNLLGRYMLADRREFPCQVQDMSPGGMALVAPVSGKAGERVVASIDHLGRLEGAIIRVFPKGFAMSSAATPRKRGLVCGGLPPPAASRLPRRERYRSVNGAGVPAASPPPHRGCGFLAFAASTSRDTAQYRGPAEQSAIVTILAKLEYLRF